MRLQEYETKRFAAADPFPPLFEVGPTIQQSMRTTVRHLPKSEDVIVAIMSAMHRIQLENRRPVAVLIGSRWFAALDRSDLDRISSPWEPSLRLYVDSEMERGVRFVYDSPGAFDVWIRKQLDADEWDRRKPPPPAMVDLASRAPTDDGALAVLADWLEQNDRGGDANDLRAAQRGLQVLARMTATPSRGTDRGGPGGT